MNDVIGHAAAKKYLNGCLPAHLPQALLFVGPDHVGKETLARACAAVLLGCAPEQAVRHPRIITLEAGIDEKTGKRRATISVDAIRAVRQVLYVHQREPLVILIPHAQDLREEASNALLKIMEEPRSRVYFFLAARSSDAVLSTVRSRSVVVRLSGVATEEIISYVSVKGVAPELARAAAVFAGGRPGLAITYVASAALRDQVTTERTRFEKIIAAHGLYEAEPLLTDLFGKKEDHLESRAKISQILEWWLLWLRCTKPFHAAVPQIASTIGMLNENMHPRLLMERVVVALTSPRITPRR